MMHIRIFGLLIGLVFLAGLLAPNHYFPWAAFYNEAPAGLAILPLAFYCLFLDRGASLELPRYSWLLFVLPVLPILQWATGLIYFSGDAWIATLYLSAAVGAYVVGYLFARSPKCGSNVLLRWLAWLFAVGSIISAAIALRQAFGLNGALWEMEVPFGARPYANLAQPNQLATMLLIGLISAVYLFTNKEFGAVCFSVIALLLGMALAAAQSRTSLLSTVLLCIWVYWKFPNSDLPAKIVQKISILALSIFIVLWFSWPIFYDIWLIGGGAGFRTGGDHPRLLIWQQMLEAVLNVPLLGYGWGQVSLAQLDVVDHFPNSVHIESAHNLFLDLLIWNGIPLGVALIVLIIIWGVTRAAGKQTINSWFALAAISLVMVHALLEFPLHYAYFLIPVGIFAGAVDALRGGRIFFLNKTAFGIQVVISSVIFLGVVSEYPIAEARIRELRFESMGIVQKNGLSEQNTDPLVFLNQIQSFISFAKSRAAEEMSDDEIERMRIVAHRFPFPPSLFRYSLALALNGYVDAANLEMHRLRNLHGEKHYAEAKSQILTLRERYPQLSEMSLP